MLNQNYATFLEERQVRGRPHPFTDTEVILLRDVAISHLLLSILGVISLGMTVLAWSQLARKMQPPTLGHHVVVPDVNKMTFLDHWLAWTGPAGGE
eukprot:CAMPEP_0167744256 /NCGR_PEP_ID=MMETSP0110_2-20121227/2486_1 /TAXON_ID=629695 /ORGANISM="Gymnochlora sp., Strain CCMP2014" /LENGTH=95 /DNA_ID=CAMNT_0007628749 /DNA_START=253 /DNA_END=540 /DNA_ORIENTATION=+